MSIIVTPGETALITAFEKQDVKIKIENLLVGDVHIRKGVKTVYIFERKAKGDLDASIKDGRYHEQKSRLLETGLAHKNIVYIIEQLVKPRGGVAAHKRIWSAICNSQHRDGFTVFQTKNTADTVDYLVGMAGSVAKFDGGEKAVGDSVNVNIKKRTVSPEEWFKYSLTLIPKVSLSIAEVITTECTSMSDLILAIEESGTGCLAELKHGNTQRRIGTKLSQEICDTLASNY